MEEEARLILAEAVDREPAPAEGLGTAQERVWRGADQRAHSSRRRTIGDGQEQRRAEPPHLSRLVGPVRQ